MATVAHHGHARDGRLLASSRFSDVLEADLEGEKTDREKANSKGSPRVDLSHGARESHLGCAAHPRRAPRDPELAKRWLTFLRNHREAIAAMDFFTVSTKWSVVFVHEITDGGVHLS
jgi:hypothetical protein